MHKKILLTILATLALSACGDTWLGAKKVSDIQGERVSVLLHDSDLKADLDGNAPKDVLLPIPQPNTSWPQAGGFSHHAMHHMVAGDSLGRVWMHDIGEGGGSRDKLLAEPIVIDNVVYTLDTYAQVSAYRLDSGKPLWRIDLTPEEEEDVAVRGGGLAYDRGGLYVATGFAEMIALNPANGAIQWRSFVGAPVRAAPTVQGGRVFVPTVDSQIIALAADDGRELWRFSAASEMTSLLGGASPAVDSGVVVAVFPSGEIHALRVESGVTLWSDALSSARKTAAVSDITDIRGRPVIYNGIVFVSGHSDMTVAIDLRTGERLWERDIGSINQPWVAGRYLYVLTNHNELVCMENISGDLVWVTQLSRFTDPEDKEGRIVWYGPMLVSDRLLVAGSDSRIMAVSPYDGRIMGYEILPDAAAVAPIAVSGSILFLTEDADLACYR